MREWIYFESRMIGEGKKRTVCGNFLSLTCRAAKKLVRLVGPIGESTATCPDCEPSFAYAHTKHCCAVFPMNDENAFGGDLVFRQRLLFGTTASEQNREEFDRARTSE